MTGHQEHKSRRFTNERGERSLGDSDAHCRSCEKVLPSRAKQLGVDMHPVSGKWAVA